MSDAWNPAQYERFRNERAAPFFDLAAKVKSPEAIRRVIDLGCGTGELTATLADRFPNAEVEGVDNSEAMLAKAASHASSRVRFRLGDIASVENLGAYDLVLSNAALQWVPDHVRFFPRLLASLASGAQLAIQMPRNFDQPSHTVAAAIAAEEPFRSAFDTTPSTPATLGLERYATLLFEHGLRDSICDERIYGHVLPSSAHVVEWVKGTLLNAYLPRLAPALQTRFVETYRTRLLEAIGERSPYFFPFRRAFLWGRKT